MNIQDIDTHRHHILQSYFKHPRALVWRRERAGARDPYHIAVSEIMSQQTQAERASNYFARWIAVFPDWQSLANAQETQVLQLWSGLGYYRRAKALHALAQKVQSEGLPRTREALEQLPGIGPYTAGAILSLGFNQAAAIVDGNVIRVFCRLFGWHGDATKAPLKAKLWQAASLWAACDNPGEANEALMDFGATICTPKKPLCETCPLAAECSANANDAQDTLPSPKPSTRTEWQGVAWIIRNHRGQVLLVKSGEQPFLGEHWHFPITEGDLQHALVTHSITKYAIRLDIREQTVDADWAPPASLGTPRAWVHPNEVLTEQAHSLGAKIWSKCKH